MREAEFLRSRRIPINLSTSVRREPIKLYKPSILAIFACSMKMLWHITTVVMSGSLGDPPVSQTVAPKTNFGSRWEFVWFALHLATVYVLVHFATPWLAGWTYGKLLPFLQIYTSSSVWEFQFSHVFMFSFIPALITGSVNARFKHKAALLVWIVPTAVLVYKLATFSFPHSVLYDSPSSPAWHYYFGSDFLIPRFHSWRAFWDAAGSNPDMARGMAQLTFTAPFYAGLAYSSAAWISMRLDLTHRVTSRVEAFEKSKFGPGHDNQEPDASNSPELTEPQAPRNRNPT